MDVGRDGKAKTRDDAPRNCSYYKPGKDDFRRLLNRLKEQRGLPRTPALSATVLSEANETKHEKKERFRQETLLRDQYILSTRSSRHVIFAAKYAKIKNQGLIKCFDRQVRIWSQELLRNFRQVDSRRKTLEQKLINVQTKPRSRKVPRLQEYDQAKVNLPKEDQKDVTLPRLKIGVTEKSKVTLLVNATNGYSTGRRKAESKKMFTASAPLPPIE